MKAWIIVFGLLLAVSNTAAAQTPPAAAAPKAPSGWSGLGQTLLIGAGVIGGAAVADLLIGGTVTRSLFGLSQAAAAPTLTSAQLSQIRAARAVVGETIVAATAARDVPARADLLRALSLGLGGIVGWLTADRLVSH